MPGRARTVLLGAGLGAALALAGCGASAAPRHSSERPASRTVSLPAAARATAGGPPPAISPGRPRHPVPSPGSLPQTPALPSAQTPGFHREMLELWSGVVSGQVEPALGSFFPEGAYLQVKAISDPAADWHSRLVGGFALDLAAAHRLLGAYPAAARLVGVTVPAGYAHWVPPGVCENRIGYWEVPNSRMIYRIGRTESSFGIASMISWRGVWYVVHLGAVVPTQPGGEVDDPSAGTGTSAPSSTC